MRWELDPDLALHTRLSLGRYALLGGATFFGGLGVMVLVFGDTGPVAPGVVAAVSLGALVMSLPFAAIHILTLDGDGRLDQQRLSGRSDVRLAAVLLGGSSWVLLLFGLPAFILIRRLGMTPVHLAALVIGAAAAANVLLVFGRASGTGNLPLAMFAGVFTLFAGMAVAGVPFAALAAIVGGSIIWVSTVPRVLRRIRRPATIAPRQTGNLFRPLLRMRSADLPEFTRAILSARNSIGLVLIGLAVVLVMTLVETRVANPVERAEIAGTLIYVPLLIAGLDASSRIRREQTLNAMERIWLSGQGRWAVVLQLAAAYGLPFVIISVAAAIPLVWVHPSDARQLLAFWPLVAAMTLSVGMAEGLRGRRIAVYVVPAVWGAAVAVFGRHGSTWWASAVVLWLPLVMAVECLEKPDGAPVPERLVPFAAASLGAAMTSLLFDSGDFYFFGSPVMIAAWMSLAAGLLLPDHAPLDAPRRRLLIASVACGLAAAFTEYYAISPEMRQAIASRYPSSWILWPSTYALLTGAMAAAGFACGWLAHTRFGVTRAASLVSRTIPLLLAFAIVIARNLDVWPSLPSGPLPTLQSYATLRLTVQAECLGVLVIAIAVLLFLGPSTRHARHQS